MFSGAAARDQSDLQQEAGQSKVMGSTGDLNAGIGCRSAISHAARERQNAVAQPLVLNVAGDASKARYVI